LIAVIESATPKRRITRPALPALACALVLAAGVAAGCGGDGGGGDSGSAQSAAAAYVEASNERDFDRVCEVLSDGFKEALHITSDCPRSLEELSSGGEGPPELKLLGVQESGDQATANAEATGESGQAVQVQVTLQREGGDWRVTSLGGQAPE
jgi:hypothetical protein